MKSLEEQEKILKNALTVPNTTKTLEPNNK